ncbi:MAG: NAD(P)/FAD-dependent oxidoreductase [Luteolibacter sp.]
MNPPTPLLDVIVVGGSFAGLSAAMQLARARRRVMVIDSGLPRNRFSPAAHGFLGQDGKPPSEILREASAQLAVYPTVERVQGEVTRASQEDGGFAVELADGRRFRASRLILATGQRDGLPDLPGLQERWGISILHCPYCHGYEVRDQPLGVLASHPMSLHQALLIPDWGPTTYFSQGIHEPDAQQAAELAARGVRVESTPVVELIGEAPTLEAVRLADDRIVPMKALFVASALQMASPLAEQLGCAFDEGPLGPCIQVDEMKQTSVPGVFAAGDAAAFMHNVTLASASGVMAGISAHRSLVMEAAGAVR